MVIVAIGAPWIAPFDPNTIHKEKTLEPPGDPFFFGTDSLARDFFSRIIYGARVSLTVGVGAVGLSIFIATVIGLLSGYFGGTFDTIFQRIIDAFMAFPWLLIMLTIMAVLGPGTGNVILAMAIGGFSGSSRVIRSAVLMVKENEFVIAARAIGCSHVRILVQHILPNVVAPIIVMATMGLGNAILAESALSFLGFGVPPPAPSWGRMLSWDGLTYMFQAPWLAIFPGMAISLAVFGFNMLGDTLRDLLDPKLTGGLRGRT
jgi:peptide/nickel transport system permease protein